MVLMDDLPVLPRSPVSPSRYATQARNALKRIAKMPYTLEMAEEFEQAYLHLAHMYIDKGKYDLAQVIPHRDGHHAVSYG